MSTTTSAIPSTNVNVTSNLDILTDPRAYVDFHSKARTLKYNIQKKLNEVLANTPSGLFEYIKENCILSGSSISSLYHSEAPKDYDLWFKDAQSINVVKEYIEATYPDEIAELSEEYNGLKTNSKVITKNAITFKNKMQMIILGDYQTMRKTFDFTHCLPYYDIKDEKFYISEHQMELIARKKLEINPGGKTPVQWRIEKFKSRGWSWSF